MINEYDKSLTIHLGFVRDPVSPLCSFQHLHDSSHSHQSHLGLSPVVVDKYTP